MIEVWKDVKGYEGLYQVSNLGRVKSLDRNSIHESGLIRRLKGKILKYSGKFYDSVGLCKGSIVTVETVHRLVAENFIPNPYNKKTVNHIDGNKKNNIVTNLEWNTHSENVKHAFDNGLKYSVKGETCGRSKLNEVDVINIRAINNLSFKKISKIYNVSAQTISDIKNNRKWKHI